MRALLANARSPRDPQVAAVSAVTCAQEAGDPSPPSAANEPDADENEAERFVGALRTDHRGRPPARFEHTRWLFLRALGFVYLVAFAVLFNQGLALLGSGGLLPAQRYLARLQRFVSVWERPTLFWWTGAGDRALSVAAGVGLGLALLLLLGVDHVCVLLALWLIDLSVVHVGQIFYGYGWETLLLETGFLAVFLGTVRQWSCRRATQPVPRIMHFWLCWLLFRVMFGAGLIKLRGDSCWRDLTCLYYHYETQPLPHALSRVLYWAPHWFQRGGVLFNHFVELLVPFGLFVPRLRNSAALITILFQVILILSGNLAFLNWLTIAVAIGCIDDRIWTRLLPRRFQLQASAAREPSAGGRARRAAVAIYSCAVALLSLEPTLNLLSPRQRMNSSFEPLHLVNTYGAFGSISRERDEVILEGTSDADLGAARFKAYEFKCKPGGVSRMPCWITPYHYRLDWQMWFAALSSFDHQPWLAHLIYKLLHNDARALSLLANQPFPNAPPRYIRAQRYRYHFTRLGSTAYWRRERIGSYAPAFSRDDPRLLGFLRDYGLMD